ncbi:MAG TPA: hypothetical protein VJU58_15395 [Microbacterium sp.]|nr:hypothetical protein [Microbacterium sp.]
MLKTLSPRDRTASDTAAPSPCDVPVTNMFLAKPTPAVDVSRNIGGSGYNQIRP